MARENEMEPGLQEDEVDEVEEEIGEVDVAEYVVLLFAVSTYKHYLIQRMGGKDVEDLHIRKGINLVRLSDASQGDMMRDFFAEKLTRPVSKATVARTFRVRISTSEQLGRRANTLRMALHRSTDLAAIFKEPRARRAIKVSVAANVLSEPAEAFADYATVPLRNSRIKHWIKDAQDVIGSGSVIQNPVEVAAAAVVDQVQTLQAQQVVEESKTEAEDIQGAKEERTGALQELQSNATKAARAALEVSGEDDSPPTRSEVIGIATAAVAAATANLADEGMPESLRGLDAEQRAAALTDGRVLVAAGAGAGKSTTLVARVAYLVSERKVDPSRILVSSFSVDSAGELAHKIGVAIGGGNAKAMLIGTLHSVFKSCIDEYGNAEEQLMFPKREFQKRREGDEGEGEDEGDAASDKKANSVLSGSAVAGTVNRIWRKCFGESDGEGGYEDAEVPSAKEMLMAKTRWAGTGITPAMAKEQAKGTAEKQAALWFEMYEGLKGAIPGWQPACTGRPDAMYEFKNFNTKVREKRFPNGRTALVRLGDYDDMISTFLEILKRTPAAKASFQKRYDHIMIDECQDLNTVQNQALAMMTEHIERDATDKSFWMVGDDKQSIYEFRGAQPGEFTSRADDELNTKLRMIRTNYRCPPEVVDAANRLISNNKNQIKMEAIAAPGKARGAASVLASVYVDESATAIAVATEIRHSMDEGVNVHDHAILTRNNGELNSFETALLMRGIPYARRGASSFLSAPDTKAFMGYLTLVTDTDTEKTQSALLDCLNKPNRFFLKGGSDALKRAVDNAVHNYARKMRMPKKAVNAYDGLRDYNFQLDILRGIGTPDFRLKERLTVLDDLVQSLGNLQEVADNEESTTEQMFGAVLDMPGVGLKFDKDTGKSEPYRTTFSGELSITAKDYGGDAEDDSPPESEKALDPNADPDADLVPEKKEVRLGNIAFLYELAKPDPDDPADRAIPPTTPKGFWAKMGRLTAKAKELRYDLNKWNKAQRKKPPNKREPAPGVYLGTIHSTKGAQWDNVFLNMPGGRFPMIKRRKEEEITEATQAEDAKKMESERRLAYVAMTRPKKNLRIVAPAEYNGKPAGMSEFLYEAGLSLGENVPKPGAAEPEPEPRTAAFFVEDYNDPYAGADELASAGGTNGW